MPILLFLFFTSVKVFSLEVNPNLATKENGIMIEASSTASPAWVTTPDNILDERMQLRWEPIFEKAGAWILLKWQKTQIISELWIAAKATPYDFLLDPYMRTSNYLVPKKVKLTFSDGCSMETELRLDTYLQLITLPKPLTTTFVKVEIISVWENSGINNTGLCKVMAFSKPSISTIQVNVFEMYDVKGEKPVQSAKVEIINPGATIRNSKLQIFNEAELFEQISLDEIPAKSTTVQQVWIPAVFVESKLTFKISTTDKLFKSEQTIVVKPYSKNYFDGGKFNIICTNHNDLGWLDTQPVTADYRSNELIIPALDLMKQDPDFKYTMESIEYLKEFLVRQPERKEEMAQRIREKRFNFGAGFIQNLQVHVGQEKLIRQFYLGRRWLIENLPGCDSKLYFNTDVPGFTYQLPQILKKSGIDFMVQGRMAWGFYNWMGLDGTIIPMYAFRYSVPYGLMNPVNNTGWLKFMNEREYFYKPHKLPNWMLYDFNADYMPPCPDIIPFVKNQNIAMEKFAGKWNENFANDSTKQIEPAKIQFVEPESAIREIFANKTPSVETLKGDWPMSWAYYDEPGNREGLLMGRKGHNELLTAENLFSWLKILGISTNNFNGKMEQAWLANCWPDHGWGGNRGTTTDSIYVASYKKSLLLAKELTYEAGSKLLNSLSKGIKNQIPVLVFNSKSWERTEIAKCTISYPNDWKGLSLQDENGNTIPVEIITHLPEKHFIELAFLAKNIPSFGFRNFVVSAAKSFPKGNSIISGDSIENEQLMVKFGAGGISSVYDKIKQHEILKTDKFFGGEVIQLGAPDMAWESLSRIDMTEFDKTSQHSFKTIRAEESPIRFIIEKEATFNHFTLRERFILNKHSRELIVEADVLNWSGEKERELRILFPLNMDKTFRASYEIPFGTVEMGRDEVDYSLLPNNYECQFGERYARNDLPFREAVNWVDVSTGNYKGNGCTFASDMTVHLFKDETTNAVDYPIVQHVMLSTRRSLAWNPDYWFTQAGNHSYRMALYPHEGNWRLGYKNGIAFNAPLMTWTGKAEDEKDSNISISKSLIEVQPANIVVSALKPAEDGTGLILRLYDAEGKFTSAQIKGFRPFTKVSITDMLEYNPKEIPVQADGSISIEIKPWEIVNLKIEL